MRRLTLTEGNWPRDKREIGCTCKKLETEFIDDKIDNMISAC